MVESKDIQRLQFQNPENKQLDQTDEKDPCPVFDGSQFHLYGSGGTSKTETWTHIMHATAPSVQGPWTIEQPVVLALPDNLETKHVAAPGVVHDDGVFSMVIQTEFTKPNGKILLLQSNDGEEFNFVKELLTAQPNTDIAGIYDPHPTIIDGKKYIAFCGFPEIRHNNRFYVTGDIFLAEPDNNDWNGNWSVTKKILSHEEVPFHNPRSYIHTPGKEYEWGLEGPQLLKLTNSETDEELYLLNSVCFLSDKEWGTRQRVFFSVSRDIKGPYVPLDPLIEPANVEWGNGENGHAAALVEGDNLYLFHQARPYKNTYDDWRYGIATFSVNQLIDEGNKAIDEAFRRNAA